MVSAAAGRVETATEGEPGQPRGFPPGHFYSPIPSVPQIRVDEQRIFALPEAGIPAVDLNDAVQCRTLEALARFHDQMPFGDEKTEGLHYFFRNPAYSYGDATVLYAMLLHLRPRRLIEIGSGYSSCVTLDVNERLLNGGMQCTFIDPHPELLRSLITEADAQTATIIPRRLQEVDSEIFDDLESNDVLFVDSTHVSKIDSDVNHLFFRILPRLRPGVRSGAPARHFLPVRVPPELDLRGSSLERALRAAGISPVQRCVRDPVLQQLHVHDAPRRARQGAADLPEESGRRLLDAQERARRGAGRPGVSTVRHGI
ncbi:MAG: class I SAM-dependent methyltransferase [Planctomycetota bacterium]|jgi:hypothetical protein